MIEMTKNYEIYKTAIDQLPLPLAVADLDVIEKNADELIVRAGELPIRMATKSLRCVSIIKHLLQYNRRLKGLMCYAAEEADYLCANGLDDILIAYPFFQPFRYEMVAQRIKEGKKVMVMADHPDHFIQMQRVSASYGIIFSVCLDIDMSSDFPGLHFGVYRSPLKTASDVGRLLDQISGMKGFSIDGIMGYDAQIAGIGDNMPGKFLQNRAISWLRKRSMKDLHRRKSEVIAGLHKRGKNLALINAGGTGSLEFAASEGLHTEVTAGSGFYAPGLFDHYSHFKHTPAVFFALEIVRVPAPGVYTCAGGGYIASGSVGIEKLPYPFLPAEMRLTAIEGAGEVQTPVIYKGKLPLQIGDPLFFRHSKAGELCERFPHLYLIRGNKVIEKVPTYRGDNQCFF